MFPNEAEFDSHVSVVHPETCSKSEDTVSLQRLRDKTRTRPQSQIQEERYASSCSVTDMLLIQSRSRGDDHEEISGNATTSAANAKRSSPDNEHILLYKTPTMTPTQELSILRFDTQPDIDMIDAPATAPSEGHTPKKRLGRGDMVAVNSPTSSMRATNSASPPAAVRSRAARPISAPSGHGSMRSTLGRPRATGKILWSQDKEIPGVRHNSGRTSLNEPVPLQRPTTASEHNIPQPKSNFQTSSLNQIPGQFPVSLLSKSPLQLSSSEGKHFDMVLQPETRPISQEQLVAEVKGIYAGLVMVEAKCIEVDTKQATVAQAADPSTQPKLNNEQWQALIALHRTLLHEHHDFFLASQHPSASPALRKLAAKYAMPARMWRHGIHSFLELLRHRLPASLDHMLAFIYLAYSMMALLYETVPAFEDTWIECLGDLGRYRMAIEDDDIRDREVWTGVARHWYSKASDKSPTTGRLYHHLAILARPNALQQLFYYAKSLSVIQPFTSARESILTLFEPVLSTKETHYRLPPFDTLLIRAHGLLFTRSSMQTYEDAVDEFVVLLDNHIGRVTKKFMEQGYHIAVANSVAMLGFGSEDNVLQKATSSPGVKAVDKQVSKEVLSKDNVIGDAGADTAMDGTSDVSESAMAFFIHAQRLSNETLLVVLQRIGDPNILPFLHVSLVFMYHAAHFEGAAALLEEAFPWTPLVKMLNTLLMSYSTYERIESNDFPKPEQDDVRPLPEDFAIRGLLWVEYYYPEHWFNNPKIDDEERYLELRSMTDERKERIMWLAVQLAHRFHSIEYDLSDKKFHVSAEREVQQMLQVRQSSVASGTLEAESEPEIANDIT